MQSIHITLHPRKNKQQTEKFPFIFTCLSGTKSRKRSIFLLLLFLHLGGERRDVFVDGRDDGVSGLPREDLSDDEGAALARQRAPVAAHQVQALELLWMG